MVLHITLMVSYDSGHLWTTEPSFIFLNEFLNEPIIGFDYRPVVMTPYLHIYITAMVSMIKILPAMCDSQHLSEKKTQFTTQKLTCEKFHEYSRLLINYWMIDWCFTARQHKRSQFVPLCYFVISCRHYLNYWNSISGNDNRQLKTMFTRLYKYINTCEFTYTQVNNDLYYMHWPHTSTTWRPPRW